MNKIKILLVGLLSFLFGCNSTGSFKKKNGEWFYKDQIVSVKDKASFIPYGDGYAKDKFQVYYFDTYRKGQEYWLVRHVSSTTLEADPATFIYLKDYYARDKDHAFFKGEPFAVRDPLTFEPLYYGYQKDAVSGYYERVEIAGSDGKTFKEVWSNHAKDKKQAYYSSIKEIKLKDGTVKVSAFSVPLTGSDPLTFKTLYEEYAADAQRIYYQDKAISTDIQNFKVLEDGYAKTLDKAYYKGLEIPGVDVATFTAERTLDSTDAKDTSALYFKGKKLGKR